VHPACSTAAALHQLSTSLFPALMC
jgi:hypothetical protein